MNTVVWLQVCACLQPFSRNYSQILIALFGLPSRDYSKSEKSILTYSKRNLTASLEMIVGVISK